MRRCLFSILLLIMTSAGLEASCVDPSTLVRSTVSIMREFGEEERLIEAGRLGVRGTGWFISPRSIVTAAHVADAMYLSAHDWRELEVRERNTKWFVPTRIAGVAGSHAEKMVVLELKSAIPDAAILPIRMDPLVPEDHW